MKKYLLSALILLASVNSIFSQSSMGQFANSRDGIGSTTETSTVKYIQSFTGFFSSAIVAFVRTQDSSILKQGENTNNVQKVDSDNEYNVYLLLFLIFLILLLLGMVGRIMSQISAMSSQIANVISSSNSKGSGGGNLRINDVGDFRKEFNIYRDIELPRMINGINEQILRVDKKLEQLTGQHQTTPQPVSQFTPIAPQPTRTVLYTDRLDSPQGWNKAQLSTIPGLYKMDFPPKSKTGKITINLSSVNNAILNNPFQSFPGELCEIKSGSNINVCTNIKVIKEGEVIDDGSFIRIKEKIVIEFIK